MPCYIAQLVGNMYISIFNRIMKYFAVLLLMFLSGSAYSRAVYHFESSQLPDERYTEGCSIVLDSEHPDGIVLMPDNRRLRLKGVTSYRLSGSGDWQETYGTERKKRVRVPVYGCSATLIDSKYSVVLFKDIEKGVYAVELLTGTNRIRFVPRSGEALPVMTVPPLFIEEVQFANMNDKGGFVNDYGDEIVGREVKILKQKMIYRSLLDDIPLTLDIRLRTPEGRLMRDADSPKGCTRRIVFRTGTGGGVLEQQLGELKAKFGKGYRMEIYCDGRQLLSVPVPTRGELLYVPICHRASNFIRMENPPSTPLPDDRAAMFKMLYQQNYTGPIYNGNYIVTGWRIVEI